MLNPMRLLNGNPTPGDEKNVEGDERTEAEARLGDAASDPVNGSVQGDRAALIAFYHATGGPSWKYNDNWLSDLPLDEWSGVQTDETGRVVSLIRYDDDLEGTLPKELANLAQLQILVLDRNQLSGEIPRELGILSNLQNLQLNWNRLSGRDTGRVG